MNDAMSLRIPGPHRTRTNRYVVETPRRFDLLFQPSTFHFFKFDLPPYVFA
jgi:hypothetical protein